MYMKMEIIIPIILLLFLITPGIASLSFAPWVPTRKKDLKRIFKLADLKPNDKFYELGCGTGIVTLEASNITKGPAIGLEISLPVFLVCLVKKFFSKNKNLHFKYHNLFSEDLSSADVIYFFGLPGRINTKLAKKLKKEVKPDAKIISCAFPINGWKPKITDRPEKNDLTIYLYTLETAF